MLLREHLNVATASDKPGEDTESRSKYRKEKTMTLEELLMVTNESTTVEIVDADTGELYATGTPSDLEDANIDGEPIYDFTVEDLADAEVMDINVYRNTLTICIDVDGIIEKQGEVYYYDEEEDYAGWAQQDLIDSYRRER